MPPPQQGASVPSRPVSLTPVADALARLTAGLRPVAAELVPVDAAIGRVLAEPIRAPDAVPPRAVALRDGWAVAAIETVGASPYTPVILSAEPRFVTIGAALPAEADAVLPPDAVSLDAGYPEVIAPAAPGENVRRAGEDAAAGAVLRAAGERVRALDIALARGAGVAACSVRRARVRVFGEGAAGALLARWADTASAAVEHRAPEGAVEVPDPSGADAILVIGARDAAACLDQAGATPIASALALRPGEGVACGRFGAVPVLVLPDRLETALAVALVLLRPCLEILLGATAARPVVAPLTRKLVSQVGLSELALLRETNGGLEPIAVGDITLTAMAQAGAWLAVPPESEGFAAGESVRAFEL